MITAVIGHARSPEGRKWGKRIDGADRVVRMWNWAWQEAADYGSRYDWGLIEVHKVSMADWREHNRRTPSQGWIASLLLRYRAMAAELPPGARLVNQEAWLKQPRKADWGCGETGEWQLTRGGVAACWAITTAKAGDSVVLVGFDNIRLGVALPPDQAFGERYRADPAAWRFDDYAGGVTKYGNHDFPAERKLIGFLATRAAVTVEFAQDVWP